MLGRARGPLAGRRPLIAVSDWQRSLRRERARRSPGMFIRQPFDARSMQSWLEIVLPYEP
jgi:hypothetical protein